MDEMDEMEEREGMNEMDEMDEMDESEESDEMEPFDEYGDVKLQVGHGDEFLVSSESLSAISPVFRQMFNSESYNGQPLSATSPTGVRLNDGKSKPIKYICSIAHEQDWRLPEELSLDALADFAVACHTYQCHQAVTDQSKIWFEKALEAGTAFKYEKLLFVAYVLDLPEEFMEVTQILTRDVSDNLNIEPATCNANLLPMTLLDELIEAKSGVVQDIDKAVRGILFKPEICDGKKKTIAHAVLALNGAGVWPVGKLCIRHVLKSARHMVEIEIGHCFDISCENCSQPDDNIKEALVKAFEKIYNNVKGLCLDCFDEAETGETMVCRVPHD